MKEETKTGGREGREGDSTCLEASRSPLIAIRIYEAQSTNQSMAFVVGRSGRLSGTTLGGTGGGCGKSCGVIPKGTYQAGKRDIHGTGRTCVLAGGLVNVAKFKAVGLFLARLYHRLITEARRTGRGNSEAVGAGG